MIPIFLILCLFVPESMVYPPGQVQPTPIAKLEASAVSRFVPEFAWYSQFAANLL